MVEIQLKVLGENNLESFLYVKKARKDDAALVCDKVKEKFLSSSAQSDLPTIQMQLWEVRGEKKPYRKLMTESYFAYADKDEVVSFLEEELRKRSTFSGS